MYFPGQLCEAWGNAVSSRLPEVAKVSIEKKDGGLRKLCEEAWKRNRTPA
jgi:hypothetical protein